MKFFRTLAIAAVLSFASATLAGQTMAQTPAAPAVSPADAGKKAPRKTRERTAKSLECSKQANAQKLHGKERRTFMNKCKKA